MCVSVCERVRELLDPPSRVKDKELYIYMSIVGLFSSYNRSLLQAVRTRLAAYIHTYVTWVFFLTLLTLFSLHF